jgi:hypothetical protein
VAVLLPPNYNYAAQAKLKSIGQPSVSDMSDLQAEYVGYLDGLKNRPKDPIITNSGYRRPYIRGFLRGRSKRSYSQFYDCIEVPEWVNQPTREIKEEELGRGIHAGRARSGALVLVDPRGRARRSSGHLWLLH